MIRETDEEGENSHFKKCYTTVGSMSMEGWFTCFHLWQRLTDHVQVLLESQIASMSRESRDLKEIGIEMAVEIFKKYFSVKMHMQI